MENYKRRRKNVFITFKIAKNVCYNFIMIYHNVYYIIFVLNSVCSGYFIL